MRTVLKWRNGRRVSDDNAETLMVFNCSADEIPYLRNYFRANIKVVLVSEEDE